MSDLEKTIKQLLKHARKSSGNAYSPYSGVKVGASLLDEQGRIHSGCNVENGSYSLTQCAERNALAAAINAGMKAGSANTIVIFATGFDVLAPCGACRQMIYELMGRGAIVVSCINEKEFKSWTIEELLPDPFALESS